MEELVLAQEELFQGEMVEVWQDSKHNYYMSREQIGEVLGYKNPRKAIKDIHIRNKSRMDKFSIVAKVKGGSNCAPLGGEQETILYSKHGIYEICRKSGQPKADAFFDWIYSVLDALERGQLVWKERREINKESHKDLNTIIAKHFPAEKVKIRCINFSQLLCELVTGYKSVGSYKKSLDVSDDRVLAELLDEQQLKKYNDYLNRIAVFLESGFTFKDIATILKGDSINITIETKKKEVAR
ncbi:BRO family protein [Enterococcus sp. AZ050]|uniref:BRO family protein n=1 Tax=Enterococcus sp. AZ050 TaxID=2774696 RepID=UPI003F223C80